MAVHEMDFIITIDTEADNQWAKTAEVSTRNATFIPRFQALCDRYGFKPTYLCTYEMVQDRAFQNIVGPMQESGRAEIGAHLHPWSSPPFDRDPPNGHVHHPFPHELPLDVFRDKMAVLTQVIREAFDRPPTSYRAGRYGFTGEHVGVLLDLGYTVDCSVAPYTSFTHVPGKAGGPGGGDFRDAEPGIYYLDPADVCRPGRNGLVEVPVTILFPYWPERSSRWLQRHVIRRPDSALSRAVIRLRRGPMWLRPRKRLPRGEMIAVYEAAVRRGLPCAEMMFHSSELMPGGSPFFPDDVSVDRLYARFEETFEHIARRGGRGATLTEVADAFRAGRHGGIMASAHQGAPVAPGKSGSERA